MIQTQRKREGLNSTMAFSIRPYEAHDLNAVYTVCLKTGDSGDDATSLYSDPDILGHLYAGPYVTLEPELAFVLADEEGVAGYILGAFDTERFNERYRLEWLPPLQAKLPGPMGEQSNWSATERLYHEIHHPDLSDPVDRTRYPSHLHIDLLPRAQGQGWGRKLINTLLGELRRLGSAGVYLGLGRSNQRAYLFYKKVGFNVLLEEPGEVYMGQMLR